MPELPQQIPHVEIPDKQTDDSLEKQEEAFLDKQARSAAFRDVYERNQHLQSLNARIDVLQTKLDRREGELHIALPRVSELEHAERTSKATAIVETIGLGGGAIFLSLASFMQDEDAVKWMVFGAGISASVLAMSAKVILAAFGWPPKPAG